MSALLKTTVFKWYANHSDLWEKVWRMNAQREEISLRLLDWLVTNYARHHLVFYMLLQDDDDNTGDIENSPGVEAGDTSTALTLAVSTNREDHHRCPPGSAPVLLNVHKAYRSWLKSCGKTNFDPFRRGDRFFFDGKSERPDWNLMKQEWEEHCALLQIEINKKRAELLLLANGDTAEKREATSVSNDQVRSIHDLEVELEETAAKLEELDAKLTTVGQLNFFRWAFSRKVFDWAIQHKAEIELDMARKTAMRRSSSRLARDDVKTVGGKRKRHDGKEEEEEEEAVGGVIELASLSAQMKSLRNALIAPESPLIYNPMIATSATKARKTASTKFGNVLREGKKVSREAKGRNYLAPFPDVGCIVLKQAVNITFSIPKADKLF